jgi:hypothetical protein
MNYAIMDDNGIIESFGTLTEATDSIERIREETTDIKGDLLVIQIHGIY